MSSYDAVCVKAAEHIKAGAVIAYPTESVYGIGCDPANEAAVQRIIDIKGRDSHKGLILIAAEQSQLIPWLAPVKEQWQQQFDKTWPGPFTFVVPASSQAKGLLTGFRDSIAVRVSKHPLVRQLCLAAGCPLVSTSANRSGQPALKTHNAVQAEFAGSLDWVVPGAVGDLAAPTTIIDVVSGDRLR